MKRLLPNSSKSRKEKEVACAALGTGVFFPCIKGSRDDLWCFFVLLFTSGEEHLISFKALCSQWFATVDLVFFHVRLEDLE